MESFSAHHKDILTWTLKGGLNLFLFCLGQDIPTWTLNGGLNLFSFCLGLARGVGRGNGLRGTVICIVERG